MLQAITTSLAGQSYAPKKTATHVKPLLESNGTQKPPANTMQKSATNVGQRLVTIATQKPVTNAAQKPVMNAAQKSTTNIVYKYATNVVSKSATDVGVKATSSSSEKISSSIMEKVTSSITEKPAVEKIVAVAKVAPTKLKPPLRVTKSIVKKDEKVEIPNKVVNIRHSEDLEKSEDNSLYVSALEDITNDSTRRTHRSSNIKVSKVPAYCCT